MEWLDRLTYVMIVVVLLAMSYCFDQWLGMQFLTVMP